MCKSQLTLKQRKDIKENQEFEKRRDRVANGNQGYQHSVAHQD